MSTYAGNATRPCYAEPVTFPATYAAAPGVVCSLTSVPVPFVPHFTGRKFTLKRHLALLRVTPQAPRSGGMSSALRDKEEIVHPASFVPHSASFTNSPLSARVGGGLPPQRASAAFAFRSPASLGGGADVSVALLWKQHRLILPACPAMPYGELHANPAQALQEHSGSPADPNGSCFSGRRLPPQHQPPGPVFLRGLRPTLRGYGAFDRRCPAVSPHTLNKIWAPSPFGHYVPSH